MIKHLKDIDGLRAIAALAVVFYHLNRSIFSDGYLGVDKFAETQFQSLYELAPGRSENE